MRLILAAALMLTMTACQKRVAEPKVEIENVRVWRTL